MIDVGTQNSTADYALVHDQDAVDIISMTCPIPLPPDVSSQLGSRETDWYSTLKSALLAVCPTVLVDPWTAGACEFKFTESLHILVDPSSWSYFGRPAS